MIINALRKTEPTRLIIGAAIDVAGVAIAANQYLHSHHIF
jgi:hypothetical protein